MLSTIIAAILFVCLMGSLEGNLRQHTKLRILKGLTKRQAADLLAIAKELKAEREYLENLRDDRTVTEGRIENLCEQLQDARTARRYYYDLAAERAQLLTEADSALAASALLVDDLEQAQTTIKLQDQQLGFLRVTIKTLEEKAAVTQTDALMGSFPADLRSQALHLEDTATYFKNLLQGGAVDPTLLGSLGGRLSRAVQVYRKQQQEEAIKLARLGIAA